MKGLEDEEIQFLNYVSNRQQQIEAARSREEKSVIGQLKISFSYLCFTGAVKMSMGRTLLLVLAKNIFFKMRRGFFYFDAQRNVSLRMAYDIFTRLIFLIVNGFEIQPTKWCNFVVCS